MTAQFERLRAIATEKGKPWPQEAIYAAFFACKANPAGHAEFMARARKRYPKLPPGAQQAALHLVEIGKPRQAAAYAARAAGRWKVSAFTYKVPKAPTIGQWHLTAKDRREVAERLERYRAAVTPEYRAILWGQHAFNLTPSRLESGFSAGAY